MKGIMESSTRIINTRAQRSGHLYGGRYRWSLINSPIYFAHALKYVYRNPVKAGISRTAAEYPYSTLGQIFGNSKPSIPLATPFDPIGNQLPDNPWDFSNWIETSHSLEESDAIRRALRRKEFQLPVHKSTRKTLAIEHRI